MRVLILLLAALTITACAGLDRINQYGNHYDAHVIVGTRGFDLAFHPTQAALEVQRDTQGASAQAVLNGLTLGSAPMGDPEPYWRTAARAVLDALGCSITSLYSLDNTITWEAQYACADGAPVSRAIIVAHREAWRDMRAPDPLSASSASNR